MKRISLGFLLGAACTLLTAVVIWLVVVYTGAYNVAASDQHLDVGRWTLDTTMQRSVARRAGGVDLPETFADDLVATGAAHYAESCAYCHGAPGQDPAGWSRGLRPEPPHLAEAAAHWSAEEIYWIVENGIKMSGMPAFGGHHGPEGLTAITAFVTRLPGLTSDDYAQLTGGGGHHEEGASAGHHEAAPETD